MSLFQFRWLRNLVRRNTKPIPVNRALLWKNRLSIGYALIAWNAFGMVCWMIYTGRNDWAAYYGFKTEEDAMLSPGQHWAKHLGIQKAKVIKFSGWEKVYEIEVDNTKVKAAEGIPAAGTNETTIE